ncbi:MAG: NAD(P)H-hydrate dehydratase [Myxococcota bacterium]
MDARALVERGWPCPSGEEMGRIDRDAIERRGLPARLLMENAGRGVALAICERFPQAHRPLVVCGAGNNGGDGFVVARVLREWDRSIVPRVLALGDPARRSPEALANLELLSSSAVQVHADRKGAAIDTLLEDCDLVVDAVLGVGLSRPVEGRLSELLKALAQARPLVALDLPSGMSSDTGLPLGVEIVPDLTVTLGLPKLGLALQPSRGEILVVDIGLPAASLAACPVRQHLLTPQAAAARLPARPAAGHKGSFGHVLVVAGSLGKTGAALLTARGALCSGAGLVTLAVPQSLDTIFESALLEAMTLPVEDRDCGHLDEAGLGGLRKAASERDAIVVGPGLGVRDGTVRLLERLLGGLRCPAVIDADGLNAFAGRPEALQGPGPRVLTPHPGEAGRLLGRSTAEIQGDRAAAARELALRTGSIVALKGARTVIAAPEGELIVNPTGGPGLASGGTGDVLAGVVGALLAQGLSAYEAAALGVYLHGLAGDLGPEQGGLAGALADRLPRALEQLRASGRDPAEPRALHRFP